MPFLGLRRLPIHSWRQFRVALVSVHRYAPPLVARSFTLVWQNPLACNTRSDFILLRAVQAIQPWLSTSKVVSIGTSIALVSSVVSWYSNTNHTRFLGISELGQAKVVLDNGKLYGGVTQDGGFTMYVHEPSKFSNLCTDILNVPCRPDVPAGTYIMSVVSHDHGFDRVRLYIGDF